MKKAILASIFILALLLYISCGKDDDPTPDPEPQEVEITSFSPTSGTVGTEVTINGKNFSSTKTENSVSFNGTAATVKEALATQLTVEVPSGASTGPIKVTVGSSSATSATDFTVMEPVDPPTVDGFEPTYGVIGTEVTITGTNFGDQASVKFGDIAAEVTDVTATQLIVTVPDGAETAPINIAVGSQSVTTSDDFTVYGPASMTMTPDAAYDENPAFEIGEEISLFVDADVPSGISEFLGYKAGNGDEPVLIGEMTIFNGYEGFVNEQLIPEVTEAIGDEVELIFKIKGEADIDYAIVSFSYTVAAQGQGGGGKYPTFSIYNNVKLGSQGNVEFGSYYSSSANAVYSNPGALTDIEQQQVDITFGVLLNLPNLISPDERAIKGLNNPLGDNATGTTFINKGNSLVFSEITATDVGKINHTVGTVVPNLLIAENVFYSFVNASGKKGYILVNTITDNGGDNKVVDFDIIVQD